MMITLLLYVLIFSMICQTQAQKWNSTCYVHSSQIKSIPCMHPDLATVGVYAQHPLGFISSKVESVVAGHFV